MARFISSKLSRLPSVIDSTVMPRPMSVRGSSVARRARTSNSCCPTCSTARSGPGLVFEPAIRLDEVPDGYRAMASREDLKVLIDP
jgi:hypothetical protein